MIYCNTLFVNMPLNKQIFISHSSKDDKIAGEICSILEKHGLTCCIDHRDFRVSKDFDQEILEGIENSSAFVLLLSSSSNDSYPVKTEVQLASDSGKGNWIFPVRIENVEPSKNLKFFLSLKQWTDAFEEPLELQLNELIKNLREFLKIEKPVKDLFYLHYQKALQYRKDAEVSIQYIEKATEGICRKILSDLGLTATGKNSDNLRFDEIIKILSDSKRISGYILIQLGIIQSFINYINKETEEETKFLTEDYLAPSLDALTTVVNWYYQDFKRSTDKISESESEAESKYKYDLILCYAPEDQKWFENNIYQFLLKSKTLNESKPKIFLACNNDTITNENQLITDTIMAIKGSGKIVFLLSSSFFNGNLEKSVLAKAIQSDPEGKNDLVVAILHPGFSEKDIPIGYLNISPIIYDSNDWVNNLTKRLGLIPPEISREMKLEFERKVEDCFINKPLEGIKVLLSNRNEESFEECEVEISSDIQEINGTLKRKTRGGVADFNDLYFLSEEKRIVLRATSPGYNEALSNEFSINKFDVKEKIGHKTSFEIVMPDSISELLFINNGEQALIFHSDSFSIFGIQSNSVRTIKTDEKLKLIDNYDNYLILADWGGKVYVLKSGKEIAISPMPENEFIYQIPANSAKDDNDLYLAYWNGYIYKLNKDGNWEAVLKHSSGIQYFTVLNNLIHVCDMDGAICSYHNSIIKYTGQLERNILGMHSASSAVIIIGEKKIYHYSPSKNMIIAEKSGLDNHQSLYFSKDFFAVVDSNGKGAILDYEFVRLTTFFSTKGSEIIFIDDNKEYYILKYPNNTRVLLKSNKVIFSNTSGPLMLDPKGEKMLIGNQNKLNIYDKSYLNKISQS